MYANASSAVAILELLLAKEYLCKNESGCIKIDFSSWDEFC